MTVSGVIQFLKEYTPPSDEDWRLSSRVRLGHVLSDVVRQKPQEYASALPEFLAQEIPPVYLMNLLSGLEESLPSGADFDWQPVLDFCDLVSKRRDDENTPDNEAGYDRANEKVCTFLGSAIIRDKPSMSDKEMAHARDILIGLLDHPDPVSEDDLQDKGIWPYVNRGLNTVRGLAVQSLIDYGLRRVKLTEQQQAPTGKFGLEPIVRAALARRLQEETSLAVHSMFGRLLANLHYIDELWLKGNLSQILPSGADNQQRWRVAWAAYVALNPVRNEVYLLLRDQYRRAINELPSEPVGSTDDREINHHLASHLMIAYWRGLETLDDKGSLLPEFYNHASDELRAHAVWVLWRGLAEVQPLPPGKWDLLLKIWRARIAAANRSEDKSKFIEELSSFAEWLANVPQEATLNSLYSDIEAIMPYLIQDETAGQLPAVRIIEYLSKQAHSFLVPANKMLHTIVSQNKQPIFQARDDIRAILSAALSSGDETAINYARQTIGLFAERSDFDYLDLVGL